MMNTSNGFKFSHAMRSAGLLSIMLLCVGVNTWPTTASAAIFKCVDAEGNTSYNQVPCTPAQETTKVLASPDAKKVSVDCRIANNFARRTAMQMKGGRSSGQVFDSYGGIDAMPRTSIGIINYVFSHKGNTDTDAQRITALSAARCSGGSYGPVGCDDFPYNFVAELGGCEQAGMSTMSSSLAGAANNKPSATSGSNISPADTQSLGVRTSTGTSDAPVDCKKDVQTQLNELFAQMRSSQSANAQGKLNDKKNSLRDQLSRCQ